MRSSPSRLLVALFAVLAVSSEAGAQPKFLDKLNNAAKKLENKSQAAPAAQPTVVGGATDFSALSDHQACYDPLKGYRSKITADMLEKKLAAQTSLTPQQRSEWQEDLAAVRAAEAAGSDDVKSPDPQDAHRYLSHLSTQEQTDLNGQYGARYNEVTSGCLGKDHMNVGHTTAMNMVKDTSAADKQQAKSDANINAMQQCFAQLQGIRWAVMADKMQAKMTALNPSGQERQDWEADIAVVKQAQAGGATMPQSPDPKNPMRFMMRLSSEEQLAMNNEVMEKTTKMQQDCAQGRTGMVEREITAGGPVDRTKSPANKNATAAPKNPNRGNAQGGALGAGKVDGLVEYNKCYEPLRGHLAKVTAEALEQKLAAAPSLTAQQRTEWQQDIASWRAAEQAGKDSADPADPNDPYRWQDHFTNAERAAINQKHAQFNNEIVRKCDSRPSGL
ncbi:MAG TPA: hypothetical protein VFX89_15815 [Gammaproteobacteria bacterium]|nr:hypothetical protein [Gammaproteobacteria bacterium]